MEAKDSPPPEFPIVRLSEPLDGKAVRVSCTVETANGRTLNLGFEICPDVPTRFVEREVDKLAARIRRELAEAGILPETPITVATVAELTAAIESMFPVHPELGNCASAPTGDAYLEFNAGTQVYSGLEDYEGVKNAGEAATCGGVWRQFLQYAITHTGTLYWREKPTIDNHMMGDYWTCKLWMRFVISDRPILEQEARNERQSAA
jgi:hypothetical protein